MNNNKLLFIIYYGKDGAGSTEMSSAIESKKLSLQIVSHCDKYFKIYLYQDVTALKKLVLHNPVSVLTIS